MIGAAVGAVVLFLVLKFAEKEGDSEFSTAALASIALWLTSALLSFIIPEPYFLLLLLVITILILKKFCMIAWWKASAFAVVYLISQVLVGLAFRT